MKKNKTVKQMEKACKQAGRTISTRYKELLENRKDPEALHQYRISMRVARSLVKFGSPYLNKSYVNELKSLLKELQDPTSKVRELDMLVKQLGELESGTGAHSVDRSKPVGWRTATIGATQMPEVSADPVAGVMDECVAVQKKTRRKFMKGLAGKGTARKVKRVAKLLDDLQWKQGVRKNGLAAYRLVERISAERIACEDGLTSVDPHDIEQVHELRKRAKALRYVTRELDDILPDGSAKTSSDMKAVQDKLGDMLDARVNARLLQEICGEKASIQAELFMQRAQNIADELSD